MLPQQKQQWQSRLHQQHQQQQLADVQKTFLQ
jgi:hypothetical protein